MVFELRQQYRQRQDLLLLFSSYWDLAAPAGYEQSYMGHACEWETSMMMVIAPGLVQGDVTQLVWSENRICLNLQGLRSFAGSR